MAIGWVLLIAVVIIIVILIGMYNSLVRLKVQVDNAWADIFAITDLANGDYLAVAGRSLSDYHLFTVVRRDAAPRYLAALRESFRDVHLVELDAARTTWSDAYPNDASQAPPS